MRKTEKRGNALRAAQRAVNDGYPRKPGAIKSPAPSPKRLSPADREEMIVQEAIKFFAETGFEGQTRELARRLGVTQPLLFHYFPTKEALIDRVYQEVYMSHWDPNWETLLKDRSIPLRDRMIHFYKDYERVIDNPEWVRIFLFSALKHFDIVQRYMTPVRERIFKRVCSESRIHFGLPDPRELPISEIEIELVWALHASIFYISIRKWVYALEKPKDIDALIEVLVDSFLGEFRAAAERSIQHANQLRL